jgi:divalent metal cation (Fe/Co/Zn/Cd) transporter
MRLYVFRTDGHHARIDGFTSLAVLGGVAGTWLGFPIVDPLIGLGITLAILYIVKDSARSIFLHILDGIEPSLLKIIETVPLHVRGVNSVFKAKARWIGHQLLVELNLVVDPMTIDELDHLNQNVEKVLQDHLPAFGGVTIQAQPIASHAPQ